LWFCEKNNSQVVTKVEAIKKLEGSMQTFEANEKVAKGRQFYNLHFGNMDTTQKG